jgi:hypothetical protein
LNEGEIGVIEVSSILEDFGRFVFDNTMIIVIGNSKIEDQPLPSSITEEEKTFNIPADDVNGKEQDYTSEPKVESGIFNKVKSWFDWSLVYLN